jgi:hypothetical protein
MRLTRSTLAVAVISVAAAATTTISAQAPNRRIRHGGSSSSMGASQPANGRTPARPRCRRPVRYPT